MEKKDEFLLAKAMKYTVLIPKITRGFKNNDVIKFGTFKIKVITIPGHTPGSLAFFCQNHLFSGDLIFSEGGLGRTDYAYSNKSDFESSLSKISKLPKGTIIHPGHGEEFTI